MNMTTQGRLASALVLGCLALAMSSMPRLGPAPRESRLPGEEKTKPPNPSCPGCAAEHANVPIDPNCCEPALPQTGPVLFTAWRAPDQRRRLRNLDISYKDQDAKPGILGDLVNQPVLITFFYTRCQNSSKCSAAVSRLAALQRQLAQSGTADKVRLLAITYEPQFDTPERINRYGHDRGLRFNENVLALQLDPERHQRLVDELEAPVNYNAGWVNTHGVELTLIDARAGLVRKYHTMLWDNNQVVDDSKRALKE
jgi:cytochrome oxidase Cu insertion factor (SCO1/SenC/PrrC family)